MILAMAKKCKHCQEFLDGRPAATTTATDIPLSPPAPVPAWYTPTPASVPMWNEYARSRPGRSNDMIIDPKADERAIWGFVSGLLSLLAGGLLLIFIGWKGALWGFFLSVAAIIHSSLGLRSVKHKGLAVAGLSIGIFNFLGYSLWMLVIGILAAEGFFD